MKIEAALFEHYEPYADAASTGELPKSVAAIDSPRDVWANVPLQFVSIEPMVDGVLTTEIAYATEWDEEHLLGARFQAGNFLELCGSVVSP